MGEEFAGLVLNPTKYGLFVELTDLFVEGLVPAESLGEGVRLDKELQRLVVGASGRSYGVGEEIDVEVVSADPARRRITLALAGKPEGVKSAPSKQRPRAPQVQLRAPHPPPRESPPGRPSRRKGRRGRGR